MHIRIYRDRASMSRAAAAAAAASIRGAIARQGDARIVAATGASQFDFLRALVAARGIDWDRVEMFHLDEYVGLPLDHPASFRRYLLDRLILPAGIVRYRLLDGEGDPCRAADEIGRLLAERAADVAFVGIGENGHLAFNDPPADFDTEAPYIVVTLDEACRRQQVGEGWFATLADVPSRAISMSIRQILKSREIIAVVPDARKAAAVAACLEGEISAMGPASVLQGHPNTTIYLDRDSASLLSPATREPRGRRGVTLELPGFFDLQVNGFAGVDFNAADLTADAVAMALERLRATGVTRCLPTLITSPLDRFAAAARVIARMADAAIAGIHMEGPYLSPEEGTRGAHPVEHLSAATRDDFERRQDAAGGRIVLVTLAPEVPGALELIEHLVPAGVRVAIGHTAASSQQIAAAIAAGATLATHLGNGCARTLPRHPNPIWDLLAADEVAASVIVDGHHLPAATVKAMVRAKGVSRTILVSDAIAAAGCAPGLYSIAGVACSLEADGRVSLPGTPYLAGSSLTLDRAIANTVRFTGLPIDEVIPMATTLPAALVGTGTAGTVLAEWDGEACELRVRGVRV